LLKKLVERDNAVHRRAAGGDQQAVVAPRVDPRQRTHGIRPAAVGQQPLPPHGVKLVARQLNHMRPPRIAHGVSLAQAKQASLRERRYAGVTWWPDALAGIG